MFHNQHVNIRMCAASPTPDAVNVMPHTAKVQVGPSMPNGSSAAAALLASALLLLVVNDNDITAFPNLQAWQYRHMSWLCAHASWPLITYS